MTEDEKVLVITSGGDWYDATFEVVAVDKSVDVRAAYDHYVSRGGHNNFGYHFREWLIYYLDARELKPDEYEELEKHG